MKIIIILILIFASSSLYSQVVVIANKSVKTSSINATDAQSIYFLNKTIWSDGSQVKVFDLKEGNQKDAFYGFINKSVSDIKKLWLKKKLTEGADVPAQVNSDQEMIDKVKSTPGSIGYVNKSSVTSDVIVLAEIK